MIPTNCSDDIGDFLDFLTRSAGSEVANARVGSPSDEVARFAELAGRPLPPLYLGYLRQFGGRDGALKMADDADGRVKTLIKFYEEQKGQAEPDIPPNGVVIGAYGLSGERSLEYPASREAGPTGVTEPAVIVSWWGEFGHTYAQTFRNHLYRQAFVRGRFGCPALFSMYVNDYELLPATRRVAADLGFEAYWFADDYQVCLERAEGEVLYIVRAPSPNRTTVYGGFANVATRDAVKKQFRRELPLQDSTPPPL